jgi:hypothetical protein
VEAERLRFGAVFSDSAQGEREAIRVPPLTETTSYFVDVLANTSSYVVPFLLDFALVIPGVSPCGLCVLVARALP